MAIDVGKKYEYSAEFKGPLKNRSCTDWPCLIIFVVFMAVWIAVGSYAIIHGDLKRFLAPVDSHGRKCGFDEEVANKPYLVFFDLKQCINLNGKCDTPQVCRSECPSSNWFYQMIDFNSENYTREHMICEIGVEVWDKSKDELKQLINDKKCAEWYLNSTSFVKRCIPNKIPTELIDSIPINENDLKEIQKIVKALAFGEEIIDTIISTRGEVLGLIVGGAAVCLIYIFLLRWLAFPFVFISIAVLCAVAIGLAYYFYHLYTTVGGALWLTLAIVAAVIAGFILLIVLCLLNRIRLACQLIKEASKAVSSILSTLLFPIFPAFMHLGTLVYVIVIGMFLWTIKFEKAWQEKTFIAIHIVGFIWLYCFITALGEMILSSTFATWYWTFRKCDVPFFTLATGAWRTIRYHLGTIAFGSLLITICRCIRYLLEAVKYWAATEGGCINYICTRFWLCCAQALMAMLEKFLKFMNRNAYIVCAVYGKGLCSSAGDALSLLLRNVVRVIVLNNIVSWLLFLGKIAIAAGMGGITWWIYTSTKYEIELWWVPVVLVVIAAYLMANVFFGVYEVAVDTLFLCFLEDCERHDGLTKPFYMSHGLRKLLRKDLNFHRLE